MMPVVTTNLQNLITCACIASDPGIRQPEYILVFMSVYIATAVTLSLKEYLK